MMLLITRVQCITEHWQGYSQCFGSLVCNVICINFNCAQIFGEDSRQYSTKSELGCFFIGLEVLDCNCYLHTAGVLHLSSNLAMSALSIKENCRGWAFCKIMHNLRKYASVATAHVLHLKKIQAFFIALRTV